MIERGAATESTDRRGSAQSEIDAYLLSVMHLLWPGSAEVRIAGRSRLGAPGRRFVAVPSAQAPKLLVPSRPRRAVAGALRQFKTAASRREQAHLMLLAFGGRVGAHDLLPGQLVIPDAAGSTGIETRLGDVLGRRVHVSLYIGPARAVRKPILQLMDHTGRTFAFAKIGIDAFTDDLIDAEAAAVTTLRAAATQALQVPDLLHRGRWNGHPLIVQSAFARGTAPSVSAPVMQQAVREIAAVNDLSTRPLVGSTYWARLTQRVASLGHDVVPDQLRRALDRIADVHASTELEFGCSHGDFAPWNMTATEGHLRVWDWEKFEEDVPVGFDMVHFAVQGEVVNGGVAPVTAFARAGERAPNLLGWADGGAARLIVRLYAIDIAARYLVDREQDAGQTRMTDLADWVGPVLSDAVPGA